MKLIDGNWVRGWARGDLGQIDGTNSNGKAINEPIVGLKCVRMSEFFYLSFPIIHIQNAPNARNPPLLKREISRSQIGANATSSRYGYILFSLTINFIVRFAF